MNDVISNSNRWVYYNQWIARFRDNYNNNESSQKKSGVQKTYVCKLDTMERAGSGGGGGFNSD